MNINDARSIVRTFVSRWDDQKLAEVLCFAEDSKMDASIPCNCLVGVSSSRTLHQQHRCTQAGHYATEIMHIGRDAEFAYYALGGEAKYVVDGFLDHDVVISTQSTRDREFIAILREVIAERDAKRATERTEQRTNLQETHQ